MICSRATPEALCRTLILLFVLSSAGLSQTTAAEVQEPLPTAASAEDDPIDTPPAADPVAEQYWKALKLFRDGKSTDWPQARELLQDASDLEFTHAQHQLGLYYLNGSYGFRKDPRKAVNLFQLAADRGNAFAAVTLGSCYFYGTGVRKDQRKAASWLGSALAAEANYAVPPPPDDFFSDAETAANTTLSGTLPVEPADHARAMAHFLLGEIAEAQKKLPEAQEHYVKAATMGPAGRAGIYQAAIKAAVASAFGQGVPRNTDRANEMLAQSKKLSRRMGVAYAHSLVENKLFDDLLRPIWKSSSPLKATGYSAVSSSTSRDHLPIQNRKPTIRAKPQNGMNSPRMAAKSGRCCRWRSCMPRGVWVRPI